MIDRSVLNRLAVQSGMSDTVQIGGSVYRDYIDEELEAFAKAVINAYVSEQKPVAWRLTHYDGSYEVVTRESWQKRRRNPATQN